MPGFAIDDASMFPTIVGNFGLAGTIARRHKAGLLQKTWKTAKRCAGSAISLNSLHYQSRTAGDA